MAVSSVGIQCLGFGAQASFGMMLNNGLAQLAMTQEALCASSSVGL